MLANLHSWSDVEPPSSFYGVVVPLHFSTAHLDSKSSEKETLTYERHFCDSLGIILGRLGPRDIGCISMGLNLDTFLPRSMGRIRRLYRTVVPHRVARKWSSHYILKSVTSEAVPTRGVTAFFIGRCPLGTITPN